MAANTVKQAETVPEILPEETAASSPRRWSKFLRVFKILMMILLFLCLIGGGFFLGIYLRVFDMNTINETLGLYKYPVIGQYFVKPEGADEEATTGEADETKQAPAEQAKPLFAEETPKNSVDPSESATLDKAQNAAGTSSKPIVLSKEEIEKQLKIRQMEEKKRAAKLARLYSQMKPAEAAAILNELNDDIVIDILSRMEDSQVAKIMTSFDAGRSARLTRIIYNGKPPVGEVGTTPS